MLGDFQRFEVSTNEQGGFAFENIHEGKRYVLEVRCVAPKLDGVAAKRRFIWKKMEVFGGKAAFYRLYVGTGD